MSTPLLLPSVAHQWVHVIRQWVVHHPLSQYDAESNIQGIDQLLPDLYAWLSKYATLQRVEPPFAQPFEQVFAAPPLSSWMQQVQVATSYYYRFVESGQWLPCVLIPFDAKPLKNVSQVEKWPFESQRYAERCLPLKRTSDFLTRLVKRRADGALCLVSMTRENKITVQEGVDLFLDVMPSVSSPEVLCRDFIPLTFAESPVSPSAESIQVKRTQPSWLSRWLPERRMTTTTFSPVAKDASAFFTQRHERSSDSSIRQAMSIYIHPAFLDRWCLPLAHQIESVSESAEAKETGEPKETLEIPLQMTLPGPSPLTEPMNALAWLYHDMGTLDDLHSLATGVWVEMPSDYGSWVIYSKFFGVTEQPFVWRCNAGAISARVLISVPLADVQLQYPKRRRTQDWSLEVETRLKRVFKEQAEWQKDAHRFAQDLVGWLGREFSVVVSLLMIGLTQTL